MPRPGRGALQRPGPAADTDHVTVERIDELLRRAVAERQALRERGSDAGALEENRRQIVALQWALSFALIERFTPARRTAA